MIFIPLPRRLIEAGDALSALVLILICFLIAKLARRLARPRQTSAVKATSPQAIAKAAEGSENSVARILWPAHLVRYFAACGRASSNHLLPYLARGVRAH